MEELIGMIFAGGSFETLAALGALVMVLEEAIDRLWDLDGLASQLRTLGIGTIGGLAGGALGWGMFSDPAVCATTSVLICGSLVGLTAAIGANFAFMLPVAKAVLELMKIRPKTAKV